MKPVVEVNNISKSYRISHQNKAAYSTLKDDFANLLKKPIGKGKKDETETFWALKDISFEVNQGEAFGIVGENGSGKSTLLKILSRIVDPTTGTVKLHGKVASMLEVGTGFHPELTGRENIYFNGSMIGMSRQEIKRKFDDIVAFSEVEKFLDTPVKFYSSGMYVRLAFAVAAHLDSDILIIDEVLAVGDAKFQKKSLNKMTSIAKEGRTILFVSHSMTSVKQICNKALLLDKGEIKYIGEAEFVTDQYLSKNIPPQPETHFAENTKKKAQFLSINLEDADGKEQEAFDLDEPWTISMKYKVAEPCDQTLVGVEVLTIDGTVVYMTADSDHSKKLPTLEPGTYTAKVDFKNIHFVPGAYYIRVSIQSPGKVAHDVHENFPLKIRQKSSDIRGTYFKGKYMGFLSNKIEWDITKK
jgi:lipopolysaccharide transport system ATP-binding protein